MTGAVTQKEHSGFIARVVANANNPAILPENNNAPQQFENCDQVFIRRFFQPQVEEKKPSFWGNIKSFFKKVFKKVFTPIRDFLFHLRPFSIVLFVLPFFFPVGGVIGFLGKGVAKLLGGRIAGYLAKTFLGKASNFLLKTFLGKFMRYAFYLPLSIDSIVGFISNQRLSSDLTSAKNRDGARTEEELKEYHKSLRYEEDLKSLRYVRNNLDPKKIYSTHFSNQKGSKPLLILFLGNEQTHEWLFSGMNGIKDRFAKDGDVDIVIFRVGNASDELKYKYFMSSDASLHSRIVYQHSLNIIEDIINGKGEFTGREKPSKVLIAGFSWGGGTSSKLLNEDWDKIGQGIPVAASAHIDAIELGIENWGRPVTRRPRHSQNHIVFYQKNSTLLNGSGQENADVEHRDDGDNDHMGLDINDDVLDKVYNYLRKHKL